MNIDDTPEERIAALQERFNATERANNLWNYPPFQEWIEATDKLTATLDRISTDAPLTSGDAKSHLALLGLDPPRSQEEGLRVYIALRAVLNFWARKLSQLEAQSSLHEQTKKEINELGRNSNIRNLGTVVR